MAFSDGLAGIAKKIRDTRHSVLTEEATKNAFIMPFISNVLGYDVFDPSEVVPEFIADVGVKKGEKVDYAIFKDGQVQILMECKKIGDPLDLRYASQLFRYFAVTSARIAILTNGQQYHVYTDGDMPNRMDEKPFLIFDLLDIDRTLVPEIQKFSKESFDLDSVVSAAEELKYIGGIRRIIAAEVKEPSEEWVRFFINRIYEGRTTQRIVDQFRPLVAKALNQYIGDQVNSRLKTALGDDAPDPNRSTELAPPAAPQAPPTGRAAIADASTTMTVDGVTDPGVETTDEELEGFNIVRAIAVAEVAPERIHYRDSKSYFAILLDDNNRKPIIRLNLNGKSVKFVTTFEQGKDAGVRRDIGSVVDIYKVATEQIRETIRRYEGGAVDAATSVPAAPPVDGQALHL
ncbi:type I restriction endonuclease [Mycolicibacterium frederiksbergense]|uniref:type I restriction endonuclease n=1 Tax=Mycolicibacterium frederiksbergense TaxID=117567 RepID=UPI00399B4B84